jgi:hypothetical protein
MVNGWLRRVVTRSWVTEMTYVTRMALEWMLLLLLTLLWGRALEQTFMVIMVAPVPNYHQNYDLIHDEIAQTCLSCYLPESFYGHYHRNQQYKCFDAAPLLCFYESVESFFSPVPIHFSVQLYRCMKN